MTRPQALLIAVGLLVAACSGVDETGVKDTAADASPAPNSAATTVTGSEATSTAMRNQAPHRDPTLWRDATAQTIGETLEWTSKVELADIDADGDVDLLFADGAAREGPGDLVVNQVFVNDGSARFTDVSEQVWGPDGDLSWAVKARDFNGDGIVDLVAGTTFETQSRLLLGRGGLEFEEVTDTHLPQVEASVGDVAVGDVDGDGDLDLALADWGPGDPFESEGAPAMLWLNDGTGTFTDASDRLPQHNHNFGFEAMDVTGDGFLDLATINDGDALRNHIFVADGTGGFTDGTPAALNEDDERFVDDNAIVWLDHDSDVTPIC